MYFSNPQLFYTISFICAFLYACLFKYELVSSVILTMKTISSVLWLMQLLESYWIFLHSMNWSYFSLHSVIELMKSELLYVSFQGQGFVFTCQLYVTVAGNN